MKKPYSTVIIDDEQWIIELLRLSIPWGDLGCEVHYQFGSAKKGLEYCMQQHPDLLLLDIRMPGLSGLEFLDLYSPTATHTKIIVVSGYDEFHYAQHALHRGAFDYLLKPIDEDQLFSVVQSALSQIREERNAKDRTERLYSKISRLETKRLQSPLQEHQEIGDRRIREALQRMNEELGEPITLDQIAASVGLSPTYFSDLFTRENGISFAESLAQLRIEKAKELLASTWLRVSEIGEIVGYSNANYFAKVFRRYTGSRPSDFRETHNDK